MNEDLRPATRGEWRMIVASNQKYTPTFTESENVGISVLFDSDQKAICKAIYEKGKPTAYFVNEAALEKATVRN